jgi:curved DNA-binding protein CbpA
VSVRRRFDSNVDYYAVLEIAAGATQEEITRRYRDLMRRSHPDRFADPAERQSAEERAKALNAAYAVLSRPAVRREYDRAARNGLTAGTVQTRYAGPRPAAPRRPTYTQRAAATRRAPTRTSRVQRSSYSKAIRQLLSTFLAITLALMILIAIGYAAWEGLRVLVG